MENVKNLKCDTVFKTIVITVTSLIYIVKDISVQLRWKSSILLDGKRRKSENRFKVIVI